MERNGEIDTSDTLIKSFQGMAEMMKCSTCKEYLHPPIFCASLNEVICENCNLNCEGSQRSKILEDLGKYLKFPCRYKNDGCELVLSWSEAKHHENECSFIRFPCPKCDNIHTTAPRMLKHINKCHADDQFSVNESIPLVECKENYFIISKQDLFVLLYKYDSESEILLFALKFVGPLNLAKRKHFKLTLKFQNKKYYERGQIQLATDWDMDDSSISINLNVLLKKFELKEKDLIEVQVEIFSRTLSYNENINDGLLNATECPICLDQMSTPIYLCVFGHSICGYCRAKVKSCPSCRSNINFSRNFALESICNKMLYKCMYEEDGCKFACLLKDIFDHEINCNFGLLECPLKSFVICTWRGKLAQVESHSLEEHNLEI